MPLTVRDMGVVPTHVAPAVDAAEVVHSARQGPVHGTAGVDSGDQPCVKPFDHDLLHGRQPCRVVGTKRCRRGRVHRAQGKRLKVEAGDPHPPSHAVLEEHNDCDPSETHSEDSEPEAPTEVISVQLKASVLAHIKEMVPQRFTLAVEQPGYEQAVSATRHVKTSKVLVTPLSRQVSWLDLGRDQLQEGLKHYLECKAAHPEITSAVLLVPHGTEHMHMLKGMQRLMVRCRRNSLFESPDGMELPLYKDKVCLYYDPPMSAPKLFSAAGPAQLSMSFRGQAQHANAVLTLDSAASYCFVASAWLKRAGVKFKATPSTNVRLADGKEVFCQGQVDLRIRIGTLRDRVRCFVLDMAGFDIILGDDWLSSRRVHMDFGTRAAFVYKGKSRVTIRAVPNSLERTRAASGMLTAIQAKRAVRCERVFLVQVTDSTAERYLAGLQAQTNDGLVPPERLQAVLDEYKDVFSELPDRLPPMRNHAHVIPLEKGAHPVFRQMYRLTQAEKAEVEKQIAELLRKGYIEPSHSPWGAPILFVPKKDGGLRMCIDYRFLNKVTVKNRYPLPRIEDLLEQLQGATVFSGLDLASGYWQIRIHDEDVDKTAFRTHLGHYQWRVLSFGLTNSPSTFQQVMNDVFRDFIGKFVVIYIDDILIYSKTAEEHERHLHAVLQRLREHELYCRPHKCHFNQREVAYLGHIVGRDGVKVDPRKIQAVAEWQVPQDQHQVRSFLGLANYFRRFVQAYSSLVRPLTDLLKAKVDVAKNWSPEAQSAFEGVKDALTHAPVLVLPDFVAAQKDKPFEVVADASLTGIGAVLLQEGHPIAFESKKFSPAERNYDTSQRELLATIHALRVWRCYLEGLPFVLVTDHHPNTAFETQKELSPRMARWYEFLTRFTHMRWEYRPGRVNVADPLSRVTARLTVVSTRYGEVRRLLERCLPLLMWQNRLLHLSGLQRPVRLKRKPSERCCLGQPSHVNECGLFFRGRRCRCTQEKMLLLNYRSLNLSLSGLSNQPLTLRLQMSFLLQWCRRFRQGTNKMLGSPSTRTAGTCSVEMAFIGILSKTAPRYWWSLMLQV